MGKQVSVKCDSATDTRGQHIRAEKDLRVKGNRPAVPSNI